jgi:hypothetical protein
MKTRLRRVLLWVAAGLVLAFVLLCFPYDPPKWTASEISARVDLLNEKAAVTTPHLSFGKKTREANLALFEKVERGQELSAEESAAYRVLYQSILKDKQSKLALLDHQLTVLTNFMPEDKNNVGTLGIEGSHDHHDASANANLSELRQDLLRLERASGVTASFARVRAANSANKNVTDIILHMATAPQTKSVHYLPQAPADELQQQFEAMMAHFKRAQFEPVNSPAYVAEVHLALDRYDALVAHVQDRVHGHLGPLERSLAGRWSTWRSLTPPLGGASANRIPRTKPASQTH